MSPQLHLHIDQEVLRLTHLLVQVHRSSVGVQLPRAKVVLLVALGDADDDVVSGVGGGGAYTEDLGGDEDVGLEAQVVVGDPQRGVLTVQVVGAVPPLTAPGGDTSS